ncbi:MAG: Grx4 family monothiol glutaredoxin [Candidatus Nitrotoga sp.]|jgi:monothiol glutaredoxin|nr:Grx4 family monothiol glutaredoxin [Candidatus Nitrotoga sp.]RFC39270.1 MAG: monothiol glutaredoxin [Candidatus Nitrotoga sp. CP45]MDO9448774.1 Grx4 family monothiol glutaredoxin [Candidatus Nitrotoga sp.]MDP1638650.1 Grx4 family monothiol glutaredoxin [Candidatus Nitrotoga sp.]MDP1856209.1 Grx4 family monothiol glutaredoxin [Candidatus Nitrotoga sp.]
MDVQELIKEQVSSYPVVLYMKGTPESPQCGFSANVVQVLNACGVSGLFTVNVLADPEIRQGIKDFSNWPTVPQLYIHGEFIGGSDIVSELYKNGGLKRMLHS